MVSGSVLETETHTETTFSNSRLWDSSACERGQWYLSFALFPKVRLYPRLSNTYHTCSAESRKTPQDTLGHADISTTLNIYADVTKELKREEFAGLDSFFKGQSVLQPTAAAQKTV